MFSIVLATLVSLSVIQSTPSPAATPPAKGGTSLTLPIAATEVQLRLTVPAWESDAPRLELLREGGGQHVLAAGLFGTPDLRVTIIGGPAPEMDGDACRKGVLGDRLLGMGVAEVAGCATAQTSRYLNPPYREIDRHAFLLGANTMAHLQVIALEQADPEQFGDAKFAGILESARFAVVRRTAWDDLPARYLELSNAAAHRVDGAAWLRERAAAPGADWITKLAAAEHAHAQRSTEAYVAELDGAVRAELAAKSDRTRAEDAGLLLAEDGLGLALLRAGDPAAAEGHVNAAVALAPKFGAHAQASVAMTVAFLRAAKKDLDGVVAMLTEMNAADPALRYRLLREPLLDSARADERVSEQLKVLLKAPSNRQLGH
jgi:hypothetical protein